MLGMISINLEEANLIRTVRRLSCSGMEGFTREVEELVRFSTGNPSRRERLEHLKHLFYRYLCEDAVEGSGFDLDVHDALDALARKYHNE
jgi:hypothetical protein